MFLESGSRLNSKTCAAIKFANATVDAAFKLVRARPAVASGFSSFCGPKQWPARPKFNEAFLQSALRFVTSEQGFSSLNCGIADMARYLQGNDVAVTGRSTLRRGLRLMLVELWRTNTILLPTVFRPGPSFEFEAVNHELLSWIRGYGDSDTRMHRLFFTGPKLLMATDWATVEDVDLEDIAELRSAQLNYINGLSSSPISGSQFPWCLLPAELFRQFPSRVSFTEEQLRHHSNWAAKVEVSDGQESLPILEASSPSTKAPASTNPAHGRTLEHLNGAIEPRWMEAGQSTPDSEDDAMLAAFQRYRSDRRQDHADWRLHLAPNYFGREHVDLSALAPRWIETFRAFVHFRGHVQRYRTAETAYSSLNLLADYLFYYLPWWKECHPDSTLELPASPKDFNRFAFVARHQEAPIGDFPIPLFEMLKLRRRTVGSVYSAKATLHLYFRFVATHFSDDERIAGPAFKSPIDPAFDLPRNSHKSKTTKEVITDENGVFIHMRSYMYALEAFGEHLVTLAMHGELEGDLAGLRSVLSFRCADFGFVPYYVYRGKTIAVAAVPNVFAWEKRTFKAAFGGRTTAVPHLSSLRILITCAETGLRGQSAQWLDRERWDSLNEDAFGEYVYDLYVNTDKSMDSAWKTWLLYRLRDSLQRETDFQRSFLDCDAFETIEYEGSLVSPFGPIRPLFRSPRGAGPVSDESYIKTWRKLQMAFETHFRESTSVPIKLFELRPSLDAGGHVIVRFWRENGEGAFCALTVRLLYTVHSFRATFITNRQDAFDIEELARSVGHKSVRTTSHYTKFSDKQMRARLEASDRASSGDYSMFEKGALGGHIRADVPTSALVKGFKRDRSATIDSFLFMPSIALWSSKDVTKGKEALNLLKSGPMSRIRFRETHICPVGEECPDDIVLLLGGPKRCGICPYAMKCVEHLTAISAKRNQLRERIDYLSARGAQLEKAGEPTATLDEVWEEKNRSTQELIGWELSERVLISLRESVPPEAPSAEFIHVGQPEFVREHLTRVVRECGAKEFLLRRLAESSAYPSMSSEKVEFTAALVRRRILASTSHSVQGHEMPGDDVAGVASLLASFMKANQLTLADVATRLLTIESDSGLKQLLGS